MKAYIIVKGMNLDDLQERVEEFIVEGYIPTGGPTVVMRYIAQAMYHPGICGLMNSAKLPASYGFGTASVEGRDAVPVGKTS